MPVKFRKLAYIFACYVPFSGVQGNAVAEKKSTLQESSNFRPGTESHRLTFELGIPRRFATRYLSDTRILQIRVIPARAHEFETSRFYDSRYIHRVIVHEENGEVTLNLQLKNESLGWMVTPQIDPWRIVVDLWRTDTKSSAKNLQEEWRWQDDHFALKENSVKKRQENLAPFSSFHREEVPVVKKESESAKSVPKIDMGAAQSQDFSNAQDVQTQEAGLPANFGRLDDAVQIAPARLSELRQKASQYINTDAEFKSLVDLAQELYKSGDTDAAVTVNRRLATLGENDFKEDPKLIWLAGESAYLSAETDLSTDYFRALLLKHPQSEYAWYAKLRLADMDCLKDNSCRNQGSLTAPLEKEYVNLALAENSPWQVKIASTLRILHKKIDTQPGAANLYQQNLSNCVNRVLVPFEMRKNCAYIQTRSSVEKLDVISADLQVQEFKKFAIGDPRIATLEALNGKNAEGVLREIHNSKAWDRWIELEKKSRPTFLDFTLKNPELLFTRAEAWEAAGDVTNAVRLYSLVWQNSKDARQKMEAASIAALLLYKAGSKSKAESFLNKIQSIENRKVTGLGGRATGAIRSLALAPFQSAKALRLLMDEMHHGRFVERELRALLQFAQMTRRSAQGDLIFEKILAHPLKTAEDVKLVEASLLRYADDLREANRMVKSGDTFFAAANLAQGTRRAESAYKAGIVYARAGLLEKAKNSWQLAASDLNDKRFSALASERLDRLR